MLAFAVSVSTFVIIAACVYWLRRRALTLALDWPETIGLDRLSGLVDTYLRHHGWKIDYMPMAIHVKMATKDKQVIRLICLPSLVEYNSTKLRDLSVIAGGLLFKPLVCVTTIAQPRHICAVAAAGQVLLLHYKNLDVFAARNTGQAATLKAMRLALLEETTVDDPATREMEIEK